MPPKLLRALALLVGCALATAISASAQVSYNFNSLTGSNTYPFTNLNGQDGWTSQGYPSNLQMGVTATTGYDGTQCLRFEDIGSGYGADASHMRTGTFAIPTLTGQETSIVLQGDFMVGYWGNILRLAYDANADGMVRQTTPAELGPGLDIGSYTGVELIVWSAAGTPSTVTLAGLGISYGDWVRLRLEIFPGSGSQGIGQVSYQDLTRGDPALAPVAGLQNVNMELNWAATGVTNPALWDAVFLHMEGAVNQFDNLVLDVQQAIPAAGPLGLVLLGILLAVVGIAALRLYR